MLGIYIILIILIILNIIYIFNTKNIYMLMFTINFILCFILLIIFLYYKYNTPKAIDVYRGKTTLEIVYRDNVPIDSTVIFKK